MSLLVQIFRCHHALVEVVDIDQHVTAVAGDVDELCIRIPPPDLLV